MLAHTALLREVAAEIQDATSLFLARELAMEAALSRQQARLALSLLQPGLFDTHRLSAPSTRTSLADALTAVREHRAELERLRHPRDGERALLFLAALRA
jgi:hypothetical protein